MTAERNCCICSGEKEPRSLILFGYKMKAGLAGNFISMRNLATVMKLKKGFSENH